MNERIGKLAEQAGLLGPTSRVGNSHEATEKFAELIVAEAVAVVQRRFMGDLNREDLEVRRCVEDLKLHFGVEL
jgi:hypothetical protein